ncbi:hypothetical protein D9615_005798 [Tricholomella constricta]|uniref:MINDY deubiquitinase domain-containing protein n=1 Tax=Tricholomella constricta TaxID=117010 RepID=A0A8H5HAS2_9AGAR|nr:hypothetical protein D9615_005798 [Tricholomella constricta]
MSDPQVPTIQSSQEDVWYLKKVAFKEKDLQIITQNFNGPCSFIAICNILILRGNIFIEPPTRTTVSYEFLSQLVAEYLLKHSPNVDISDALSIMPHTQKGLDLNPLFTSSTSFLAATQTAGGELKLFSQVGIDLVHGWLVDPDSPEARAMREEKTEDYDSAVTLIAEADHIAGGLLVPTNGSENAGSAPGRREEEWSDEERRKIRNALIIRQYLEQTQSQLTYHGLFHLASTLPEGSLVALFRSSHLSVLYKSEGTGDAWQALDDTPATNVEDSTQPAGPSAVIDVSPVATAFIETTPAIDLTQVAPAPVSTTSVTESTPSLGDPASESLSNPATVPPSHTTPTNPMTQMPPIAETHDSALYSLATDQVFLYEPSVVWERVEDVDGSAGVFVDSVFVRASPAGGDWAGRTAEDMARDIQGAQDSEVARAAGGGAGTGLSDHELARQLQAEEDHYAQQEREAYSQQRQEHERRGGREEEERRQKELHTRREKERKKQAKAEGKKKDCIIM